MRIGWIWFLDVYRAGQIVMSGTCIVIAEYTGIFYISSTRYYSQSIKSTTTAAAALIILF